MMNPAQNSSYLTTPISLDTPPVTPLSATQPQPQLTGILPAAAEQPFVWKGGGRRMTAAQIELERERARKQIAVGTDFSPVQHWTQGLARLANAWIGGMDERNARRAAEANAAESNAVARALMAPPTASDGKAGTPSVAALLSAMTNPYVSDEVHDLGKAMWERQNPKAVAPHYWETNDGSLGMIGPDGKPTIAYKDPTPKINWITADNPDKTKTLIPVGPNGPLADGISAAPPTAPVGKLTPIDEGDPTPTPSGAFR